LALYADLGKPINGEHQKCNLSSPECAAASLPASLAL
jgi:hypothetical protein